MRISAVPLRRIGNSRGVLLPRPALRQLSLAEGDRLFVDVSGDRLVLSPAPPYPPLREWVEAMRPLFGERIRLAVLFGSLARGGFDPEESDIDIFVVGRGKRLEEEVTSREYPIGLKHGVVFSSLVYTPEEVRAMARLGDPFLREVSRGVPLYGDIRRIGS